MNTAALKRNMVVNDARMSSSVKSLRITINVTVVNSRSLNHMTQMAVPITESPISSGVSRREIAATERKFTQRLK